MQKHEDPSPMPSPPPPTEEREGRPPVGKQPNKRRGVGGVKKGTVPWNKGLRMRTQDASAARRGLYTKKEMRMARPSEALEIKRAYNRAYAARRKANGGRPLGERGKTYPKNVNLKRLGPTGRAAARELGVSMAVMVITKKLQKEVGARVAADGGRVGNVELTALNLIQEILGL